MTSPPKALNIDFAALAIADADFAKIYAAGDGYIDFQDPETVQQLTKSVLKREFKLKIELPSDRLCPPVWASIVF
jgi:23S rRNA (adenine1618-N6)-methyltransferase